MALLTAWLAGWTAGEGAGAPAGRMLKSVLMATLLVPRSSQITIHLRAQLCPADFNVLLGNKANHPLTAARRALRNFLIFFKRCLSERSADRERRHMPRSRRGALAGRRVGVRNIAALHLGVDA